MGDSRVNKGHSRLILPKDYCVVDIETTGLSPSDCEVIELSAVRYRQLKKIDSFHTLVKPEKGIPALITNITGITNEMVEDAPPISDAILDFSEFIGEDILVGYNVNFDVNFIYDALLECHGVYFRNDFVDVLRYVRKALPELECKTQTKVASYLKLSVKGAHRADVDCEICNGIYMRMRRRKAVTEWTKGEGEKK